MKATPAGLLFTVVASLLPLGVVSPEAWVSPKGIQDDIDTFMAKALERRTANWITLHDYVLDERETLALEGAGSVNLYGFDREFRWYIRDGFLIQSPVRYDGVAIDSQRRVEYEQEWLRDERQREDKARRGDKNDESPEPRLISEAYFFDFTFEPGNYYFAGRETLEGHEVLRIEYYPTQLFSNDEDDEPDAGRAGQDDEREREFEGKFAKTSLVTMWVDPKESQIVKFTFENVGFDFLPLRWLVRIEDMRASMVMSQPFDGVWLPGEITMRGRVMSAYGSLQMAYTRTFSNYKEAEVSARIRSYGSPRE